MVTTINKDRLPTFLIIGAAKAGTTSLHYYLDQHPRISMSSPLKETNFFTRGAYMQEVSEYERYFDATKDARGEASPWYTCFPCVKEVPKRIHSVLPGTKLIYLVRDPIERAEAMYWERYSSNKAPSSIHAAFDDLDDQYNLFVCSSRYATQVEQYLEYFPLSSLLIVDSRDLRYARQTTLNSIFSFLGVDPDFSSPNFDVELDKTAQKRRRTRVQSFLKHSSMARAARRTLPLRTRARLFDPVRRVVSAEIKREPLSDETRKRLAEVLRSDVKRFREITNRRFDHWSV